MAQQEIRINIAGRYYALYIAPEQEEVVRRIGKNIEMMIKDVESNYATKDKQDAIAMTVLRLMINAEFNQLRMEREFKESDKKLKEIINEACNNSNFLGKLNAKQLPSKGLLNGAPSSCRITESRNKLKSC